MVLLSVLCVNHFAGVVDGSAAQHSEYTGQNRMEDRFQTEVGTYAWR
jgi:hypothetical protein